MTLKVGIIEKFKLAAVTISLSMILIIGGILYYKGERKRTQTEKFNELNAIAELKIEQISQWRKERLSEAVFFSHNENIINSTILLTRGESKARTVLLKNLIHILSNNRYENIFLINPKGELIFTIDPTFNIIDSLTIKLERNTFITKKIFFSDLYRDNTHKKNYIDIFAPLFDRDSAVISTLVFRINPESYLFPFIQSWPTPSKTAETLIIRRDSNDVVFLNRLRHAEIEPLNFKVSLTKKDIPAVQAILGYRGLFEGTDYRGKKVLSALDKIPDFTWYMVAKIDLAEIYTDLYIKAILIGIIVFITTLLMIFIVAWIYQIRQRNIYEELLTKKTELHESQEEFKATLYSIGDGVITTDEKGLVKQLNPIAEKLTGWKEHEAKGKELSIIFNIISEITRKSVENPVAKVLKEGLIVGLANHTLLISKDGKEIPIADSGAPIKDEKGQILGVVLVFRDQIEEHKHEKLLEESEERYRLVLENSIDAILITIPDGKILSANKAACDMLAMTEEEICKAGRNGITLQDERLEVLLKVREKEGSAKGELTMIRKNGEQFPIELSSSIFYTSKGETRTSMVIRDITKRKSLEQNLSKSEEKFRNIFEQHVAVKLIIDPENGNIIDANNAASNFYGWSLDELRRMNVSQINTLKGDDIRKNMEAARTSRENVFEFKHRKSDGSIVDVEIYSSKVTIQDKIYLHSIVHDISDKKKAEEELKRSKKRIDLILNSAAEGIYGVDLNGNCIFCNASAIKKLGYSSESELLGKNIHKLIHYKHKDNTHFPEEECATYKTLKNGEEIHSNDDLLWNKSGESFPVEYWSHPLINEGKVEGAVVTYIDISERKKNEQERDKLLNILDSSLNEVYIFDAETFKFEYLNRGALNNLGYSANEIIKLTPIDIKPEYTLDSFKELIKPLFSENDKKIVFQTIHKRKDGTTYPVEAHLQLHKVNHRKVFFAVINDITERKKLENDLLLNEERLSTIFDTVGDILYYIAVEPDNKFKFISINKAFCRVTGIPEEMIVGKLINEIIPEPSLTMVLDYYNQAIKEKRMVKWEETSDYPNGALTGEVSVVPVFDNTGKCTYIVGSVHDITERKEYEIELSKSKLFIETIIENLPIGLAVNTVDPNVSFEYMNDNFLKLYNTSREKIASPDTFWDAIYEDPIQREQIKNQVLSDIAAGDPRKMYWSDIPILKDGEVLNYICARNIPLYDKNLMISTVWDVTEQKRAEEQIKELNLKLNLLITTLNKLTKAQSIEELEQIVTTSARQLIGSDGCTFVLREGDTCYYTNEDAIAALWKGKKFPLQTCVSGWVIINKKIAVIPDIYKDDRVPVDAYKPTFVKSMVMVPLNTNQPFGAIGNYWSKKHETTEDEIQLISTLADATSRVYENLRMYEELENKVKEKTKELNEHIEELERFHDATVDRELRIKELREEIEKLKRENNLL